MNAAAKCGRLMEHWIRLHWFELSALALLGLNLWFVIKVSSVLRAVQDSLILLARWLDIARSEIDPLPTPQARRWHLDPYNHGSAEQKIRALHERVLS